MRGAVTTLIVLTVPVMVALPALGHAQSPTITRGALGGSLPPNASSGLLRGSVPPGATTGVVRGTLPPGGTAGLLQALPPGATVGVFRDTAAAARVPVMPGGLPPALTPVLMGPLPADASVGALTAPVSPGTRLGEPGPDEIMKGLDSQARIYLQDGNYAQGEQMLNGSVAIREDMVGRVSPGVAGALETDAQLMRHYSRDAAAADMEVRAKEIRTKLEPPPAPKKPDRF
jgi:hypothetical protein